MSDLSSILVFNESNMITIAQRINAVLTRIAKATTDYHRANGSIQLLAASKTRSITEIEAAYAAGVRHFGENYVDEALTKIPKLQHLDICWHFIGPIQANKTGKIAAHFDWVHSIDRAKIARRLNDQRNSQQRPLNCCIQLNLQQEVSKAGIDRGQLPELATVVQDLPQLQLKGLMSIPKQQGHGEELIFNQIADCLQQLKPTHAGLDTLSMGMSSDLELAIAAGATMVRIGSDIFGPRSQIKGNQ